MDSTNSSHRFENETEIILIIFPVEVWTLVFDHLANVPGTLQAIYKSSSVFRNMLHPRRTRFLFPVVWPHLQKKMDPPGLHGSSKPYVTKCLHAILQCRAVHRNWCQTINNFYQNHPKHYYYSTNHTVNNAIDYLSITTKSPLRCDKFLTHFEKTHHGHDNSRSPFIVSSLYIYIQRDDPELYKLVNAYGHHIIHCRLVLVERNWYAPFREILQKMPNLKTLHLTSHGEMGITSEQLKAEIADMPLPVLPHLVSLTSTGLVPISVLDDLLDMNGNILELVDHRPFHQEPRGPLPNLKYLSIDLGPTSNLSFLEASTKIESAQLNFYQTDVAWAQIFNSIETKLGERLTSLALYLPPLIKESEDVGQLKLLRLKSLKVWIQNWTSLDFLLPLRNTLEDLSVNVSQNETIDEWKEKEVAKKVMEKEVVNFLSCYDDMQKSNIWQLFPSLQKVWVTESGKTKSKFFSWERK